MTVRVFICMCCETVKQFRRGWIGSDTLLQIHCTLWQ